MDLKKLPEQGVSLEEQIQELERELALRERVYPKWVEAGRMSQREAQQRYLALRAALTTLRSGGRGQPSERALSGEEVYLP